MNIKNIKTIGQSLLSGLVLMVFWVYVNQMKTEAKVPLTEILDFANETEAENAQEEIEFGGAGNVQKVVEQTTIVKTNSHSVDSSPQTSPLKVAVKKPVLGPYKDGTYKATAETPWGNMSIAVLVNNGQWTKINYLEIPDSPPSQYAAKYLSKQALVAQNGSVDGVSGATYTSDAFRDDLKQIVLKSKS